MKKAFYLFLVLCFCITACKKKENEKPAVAKLKTAIIPDLLTGTIDTFNYFYNNNGTIDKITYGTTVGKTVYVYNGSTINEVKYNYLGTIYSSAVFYLNANDFVDSIYNSNTDYRYSYTYDSKGFVSGYKFRGPSNIVSNIRTYVNNGSNIASEYSGDGNGNVTGSTDYTFFVEKINTIGNENKGMKFLGINSANPIQSYTTTSGSSVTTGSYLYMYDSEGRITAQSVYSSLGSLLYTNTYSYY